MLVDDPGHRLDITSRVRAVFDVVFGEETIDGGRMSGWRWVLRAAKSELAEERASSTTTSKCTQSRDARRQFYGPLGHDRAHILCGCMRTSLG